VSATVPGTGEASSRRAVTGVRLLWLCAAITLIVAGLALAYFSPPPNQSQTNVVDVPLPPASAGKTSVLTPAPDPALVEASPNGPLPIIGKDGRQPWQVYARPFDTKDSRPRIALIVTGIGLDQTLSKGALDRLPDAITFGFDPYAGNVKDNVATARSLGHEALLGLPLEPLDYPRQDPGPLTLLTSLDPSLNADRLMTLMGKASGYVGFVAIMGARFESENSSLMPMLETLKQRGLMFADDKPPEKSIVAPLAAQMKLPWAAGNSVIDSESDPAAIDRALAGLEASAKRGGAALGIAALSPALLDRIAAWFPSLDDKGIVLAPASAVANRQSPAQAAQ
jgi:polysaccharide deacetylase 2 family uncharacterized protein YibQ